MQYTEIESSVRSEALKTLLAALRDAGAVVGEPISRKKEPFDLELPVSFGRIAFTLVAEIKMQGFPGRIREALAQIRSVPRGKKTYVLILCPFISLRSQELCKQQGVGYADAAGNCYVALPGFVVSKSVSANPASATRPLKSMFAPRASRIVRALLDDPGRRWTQLELSGDTQVSLGHVNNAIRRFIESDFVRLIGKKVVLSDPPALLKAWLDRYTFSKHQATYCYTIHPLKEFEGRLDAYCQAKGLRYVLTGFAGAAYRAPHVRFNRVQTYFSGDMQDLLAATQLKIVPTGPNIVLLRPFDEGVYYKMRRQDSRNIACDVQLYIDLMSSKERGEEQAEYLLQGKMPMLAAPVEDSSSEANFLTFLELLDRAEGEARAGRHEEACAAYEQAISLLGKVRNRDTARDRKRIELLQWLSAVEAGCATGSRDYLDLAESLFPAPEFALRAARSIGYNEGTVKFGMMLHYLLRARFAEGEQDRHEALAKAMDYRRIVKSKHTESSGEMGPRADAAWERMQSRPGEKRA